LDNEGSVPNAILQLKKLKIKTDRGDYICEATNDLGSSNSTVTLKVKGQYSKRWLCLETFLFLVEVGAVIEKSRKAFVLY